MSNAIQDLRNEHAGILSGLEILEAIAKITDRSSGRDEDIKALIRFFRLFADKCHHGKEEGFLFPALISSDKESAEALITGLLKEHAEGRELIRAMHEAGGDNPADFQSAAFRYNRLLKDHIEQEEHSLFPLAEKLLSEEARAELFEQFELYEKDVMGPEVHEQLHHLLESLSTKYPT